MAGTLRRSAVPMAHCAAFISYSSRYKDWVATLHHNLELCLPLLGEKRDVFFDQIDLGVGRSWITKLQAGVDQADQLVLVVSTRFPPWRETHAWTSIESAA